MSNKSPGSAATLRERIAHMKRLAYGAAPAVVMDIADDVRRMERDLAELEARDETD